jgi:ubiquitin C-terminal hydrolase
LDDKENRRSSERSPSTRREDRDEDPLASSTSPTQSRRSNPFRDKDAARDDRTSKNDKALSTYNYPSGFPNDQAQCYRNAALQALLSLEPFVQDLCLVQKLSSNVPASPSSEDPAEESVAIDEHVLAELVNVFLSRENRDRPKLESALKRLNDCVKKKARGQFLVDSMNDANEYINLLLESVSDLADKIKKPSGGSGSSSPVQSPPAPPNSPEPG